MTLLGRYGLLPLIAITLLLNILAEKLYFRAWILSKLSRFGNCGWVLNGVLFALYHTFQIWLLSTLFVASLFFAFIFYISKSNWPCCIRNDPGRCKTKIFDQGNKMPAIPLRFPSAAGNDFLKKGAA